MCTYCICMASPQCVFSCVSSDCLIARRHIHTGHICETFLHCVASNAFSEQIPQLRHIHTGYTCGTSLYCVFLLLLECNLETNPLDKHLSLHSKVVLELSVGFNRTADREKKVKFYTLFCSDLQPLVMQGVKRSKRNTVTRGRQGSAGARAVWFLVRFPNCKWVGEPDYLVPRLTCMVGRGT